MNPKLLVNLGRAAHLSRSAGLGYILDNSRDALDAIFTRTGKPPLSIKVCGIDVAGYLRHRSFLDHLATGGYECFTRELFEKNLNPGMTVIDGGAHIGFYSLLAWRVTRGTAKIIAFEPDPHNFSALVANIKKSQCSNVIPIQKALSNSTCNISFYQSPGTISSSSIRRPLIGKTKVLQVQSTTLDRELENITFSDILIKLDIEGGEPFALQGMKEVLRRANSAVLLLETNPTALGDAGFKPKDLVRELDNLGFLVRFIDESGKTLLPISRQTMNRKGNLYCSRGS